MNHITQQINCGFFAKWHARSHFINGLQLHNNNHIIIQNYNNNITRAKRYIHRRHCQLISTTWWSQSLLSNKSIDEISCADDWWICIAVAIYLLFPTTTSTTKKKKKTHRKKRKTKKGNEEISEMASLICAPATNIRHCKINSKCLKIEQHISPVND